MHKVATEVTKVRIQIDPAQKIIAKRMLQAGGPVQRFFTQEMRRHMAPYVPHLSGRLEEQAVEHEDSVEYNQPYARRQYFENRGNGKEGTSLGGKRGKEWDKRCWADHGDDILESVAKMAGGKVKK